MVDGIASGHRIIRRALMGATLGFQGLQKQVFRGADLIDGPFHFFLAADRLPIQLLSALGGFFAQLGCLLEQLALPVKVAPLLGGAGFLLQCRDATKILLQSSALGLQALGFTGLLGGDLGRQIHGLLRQVPGMVQFTPGDRFSRLGLQLGDLALAIFQGFMVGHASTANFPNPFFGREREQPLLLLDSLHFAQVALSLGIERVDVAAVIGGGGLQGLPFGGQHILFDLQGLAATFFFVEPLAAQGHLPGRRFLVNQAQDFLVRRFLNLDLSAHMVLQQLTAAPDGFGFGCGPALDRC